MSLKAALLAGAIVGLSLIVVHAPASARAHSIWQNSTSEEEITRRLNEQQLVRPGLHRIARHHARHQYYAASRPDESVAEAKPEGTGRDIAAADPNPSSVRIAGAHIGVAVDSASGVKRPVSGAEMKAAVALDRVQNPQHSLETAEIKNPQGQVIGSVKKVDISDDGTAKAIHVDVSAILGGNEKVVTLPADKFVYVKKRNILVTDMSKDEIAKSASNPL